VTISSTRFGLDEPETIILRFFNAPNGELQCRAREALTERSWLVADPGHVRTVVRAESTREPEPS
jgi:hypothetical protein